MDAKDLARTDNAKPLIPKAPRLVPEGLQNLNGTEAAIRTGYAPSGARAHASELLANVSIAEGLRAATQEILQSNQATGVRVVREFALIACINPASILPKLDSC